jgi:hypothetical protein
MILLIMENINYQLYNLIKTISHIFTNLSYLNLISYLQKLSKICWILYYFLYYNMEANN